MSELTITTINISAPDVASLTTFYACLLNYEIAVDEGDWALLCDPDGVGIAVAIQHEANYERPVWPSRPGEPDMKLHLEIRVEQMEAAAAHALSCGATAAGYQPQADVRVMLDPAGHPFCLWTAQP